MKAQGFTTRRRAILLLAAPALLLASCVTQERHDEALAESRLYQRMYQDLESYQGRLERENEELRGQLELYDKPIEATFTDPIDQRLDELRRIAAGLGSTPGDVTVLKVEGGYGYRLKDAVLFDSGSAEMSSGGRRILAELAAEIASRPYERIWVRGHTDADPVKRPETKLRFPHGNLELSAARAIETAVLLAAAGIDEKRIVVAGFGPNEPVARNDTVANKQRNRRVEIFVIEDGSAARAAQGK